MYVLLHSNKKFFSAWIETGCLKPYFEFKESLTYSCKTPTFKDACKAIEQYILDNKDVSYIISLFLLYFNMIYLYCLGQK